MRVPSIILSFVLFITPNVSAQQKELYTFIDPVVQTWTVDREVNQARKLFASLEINGNLRVYDLQGRKPVYLDIQSEQELGEGGNSRVSTKNMLRFSPGGEWLGTFTIRNGFKLYNTLSWTPVLELNWKGVTPATLDETPTPSDILFIGDYLVLFFDDDEYVNNGFIFDLKEGKLVPVLGNTGFNIYGIYSLPTPGIDRLELDVMLPNETKAVDILWKGQKIKTTGKLLKGAYLLLDEKTLSLLPGYPETEEEEETETVEDSTQALPADTLAHADRLLTDRLRAVIREDYNIREYFLKNQDPGDSIWEKMGKMDFLHAGSDSIMNSVVNRYQMRGASSLDLIELIVGDNYPRYYLHTGDKYEKLRYGNAFFINRPYRDGIYTRGRWDLFLFEQNGFDIKSFSNENDDLLKMIVWSPSRKQVAFAVNAYGSAEIYTYALDSSFITRVLRLPGKTVVEDWLRDDGFASYPQLSIYRFLDDEYFFFQGKDLRHPNILFETRYGSKILEMPVAGATKGMVSAGFKNILRAGESFLLGSYNRWDYKDNSYVYTPISRDSIGEPDFTEPLAGSYRELNNLFLKKLRLKYNPQKHQLDIGDGKEFISISRDANNRMIWKSHKDNLALEYYPEYSWYDYHNADDSSGLENEDPNYFHDKKLSRNVRLTNNRGKTFMLVSPFGPSNGYIKATFSEDNRYVFTLAGHHYIDIWKTENGGYVATVIPDGKDNFIIIDRDQHFYARDISSLNNIYIRIRDRVYPSLELMQFLNRPDLILSKLEFINNPQLLAFYQKWAGNREERLGDLDLWNANRPVVTINGGKIPFATGDSIVNIPFSTKGRATKAIIWINNTRIDSLDLDGDVEAFHNIKISLQKGTNKIQLAAFTHGGVQSIRETVYVNYEPGNRHSANGYSVMVGVSEYVNPKFNLEYASKDAGDLAQALRFRLDSNMVKLIDSDATLNNLHNAASRLKSSTIDDIAVIYLAGHGALDKEGKFYFCTSNTDLEDPAPNGISMQQLQDLFNKMGARKRLLILDACHSGNTAVMQLDSLHEEPGADTMKLRKRGFTTIKKRDQQSVTDRNYAEIVKQQLTDVTDETGVIVFSATSGGGVAFESPAWGNGIFTSMLIKALSTDVADQDDDGKLQIKELIEYVISAVSTATKGQQVPESSVITWDKNWILADHY